MSNAVLVLTAPEHETPSLEAALAGSGFESVQLSDLDAAVAYLAEHQPGACLADLSFAEPLRKQATVLLPPLIVLDERADVERALGALRGGAEDYAVRDQAEAVVSKVRQHFRKPAAEGPIFAAPASRRCAELAERVAATDVSVLIAGESGSGKEIIARRIHERSQRRDGPFVAINCAAIPDNMLEAILFGHVKGAFTGAHQPQPGKFELAHGGTLLLDEVSEMPLTLQAKLLRVLQEREVERIGARAPEPVDVRVLATTNVDLKAAVAEGRFREDLYYRLSVFPLTLAPLRERPEDVLALARFFLDKHGVRQGAAARALGADAEGALASYRWPGNVRELENVIQRALVLCRGEQISAEDLALPAVAAAGGTSSLATQREDAEAQSIARALAANDGRRRETAAQLGISERTLRYKLQRLKEAGMELT
jgi:two-component system response regulator FlrC